MIADEKNKNAYACYDYREKRKKCNFSLRKKNTIIILIMMPKRE